jgi:GT2 family glycosyltransferase
VYAIVVNYNGWRDTVECLDSLLRSDYADLRILVCDNASTDNSVDAILAWAGTTRGEAAGDAKPLRLVVCTAGELSTPGDERDAARVVLVRSGSNLGFAGANNIALRYAVRRDPHAYALLINNDAIMAPNAIREMVAHAESRDNVGAVGATVLRYDRPDRVETLAGARFNRLHGLVEWNHVDMARAAQRPDAVDIDFIAGCCLMVPCSTVARIGFMDEGYFLYGEDADWCLRMRRAGLTLTYCPSAEIWHKGGGTVVYRSPLHDYYAVRGTLMVLHKHFPLMLPIALVHALLRFLFPKLLRGEWDRLRAAARGYRDFIRYALQAPAGVARP